MLTAIYHMLKNGTDHHDLGANHFDRRSIEIKAKRLAAQIAKLGFEVEIRRAFEPAVILIIELPSGVADSP